MLLHWHYSAFVCLRLNVQIPWLPYMLAPVLKRSRIDNTKRRAGGPCALECRVPNWKTWIFGRPAGCTKGRAKTGWASRLNIRAACTTERADRLHWRAGRRAALKCGLQNRVRWWAALKGGMHKASQRAITSGRAAQQSGLEGCTSGWAAQQGGPAGCT